MSDRVRCGAQAASPSYSSILAEQKARSSPAPTCAQVPQLDPGHQLLAVDLVDGRPGGLGIPPVAEQEL